MKKKIVIANIIIVLVLLSLFFMGLGSIYLLPLLAILIIYQCVQIKFTKKLVAKIFLVLVAIIIIIATLLFVRKHHALSDEQLMQTHWKAYKGCDLVNSYTLQPTDLPKINKEWTTSYRWIDNSVFLHITNDAKLGNCIYIAK